MNKPILIGIVLFFIALASAVYFLKRKPVEPAVQSAASEISTAAPAKAENQRRINVKLLFTNADSMSLIAEDRSIAYKEDLHSQAVELLRELMKGPSGDLLSAVPSGTHLDDFFVTKEGIAYANFSAELGSKSGGGSQAEITTVYAIINTLTLNLPQIKRVQILVNDQAIESLNGHLDLSQPLSQDLSMVRMTVAPEPPPPAPQTAQTQS